MKGTFLAVSQKKRWVSRAVFSVGGDGVSLQPLWRWEGLAQGFPVLPSDGLEAPTPDGGTGDALEGSERSREEQIFRKDRNESSAGTVTVPPAQGMRG